MNPNAEIIQIKLQSLGLENDQKEIFGFLIQPLLSKYIVEIMSRTFTQKEFDEYESAAMAEELSDDEFNVLLENEYAKKTGKALTETMNAFLNIVLDELENNLSLVKNVLEQVKDLPEEEKTKKMEEELQNFIKLQTENK